MIFTYQEMRSNAAALAAVEASLLAEQGGICAYTGRRLEHGDFHIEHLWPQNPPLGTTFYHGHDTDYHNLVACWPKPNRSTKVGYGAVFKENWPAPAEIDDFLLPLDLRCGSAYTFSRTGEMSLTNPTDRPAEQTLAALNLNHAELQDRRKNAIRGALEPKGKLLTLPQVKKLLRAAEEDEARLDAGHDVKLRAFCFAIRPQASRLARKLAGIAESKRALGTK